MDSAKLSVTNQATHPYMLQWRSRVYGILGLFILLAVMVVLATTIGSVQIPFLTTSSILLSKLPLV